MPCPRFGFTRLLPAGVDPAALPLLVARGLRAFGDGYMAVLLRAYLLALGLVTLEVGIVSTATMLGSALATLAVGAWGYRFAGGRLLRAAALLMAATGLGFAGMSSFWPLLIVALVGTLNPSSADVSVFLPLEHVRLAAAAQGHARTALFARCSLLGAFARRWAPWGPPFRIGWFDTPSWRASTRCAACSWCTRRSGWLCPGCIGSCRHAATPTLQRASPLRRRRWAPSRGIVVRLAALFSVDAFAGGLTVNALMSLWLLERFGLSRSRRPACSSFGPVC